MKLGLLLASPPDRPEWETVRQRASSALHVGDDVYLYLIDDGVRNLNQPGMEDLRKSGIHLFACAYGAKNRGIAWDTDQATFSGLTVLVDMISACDQFLAYTPCGHSPEPKARPVGGVLPRTLVTISEDPRESHRPAEAIRIAAGIGGWKKTDVDILLWGSATHLLSPYADEYVDGDNYRHYLPIIREWKKPIFLAPGSEEGDWNDADIMIERCDTAKVEALKNRATFFIPF